MCKTKFGSKFNYIDFYIFKFKALNLSFLVKRNFYVVELIGFRSNLLDLVQNLTNRRILYFKFHQEVSKPKKAWRLRFSKRSKS